MIKILQLQELFDQTTSVNGSDNETNRKEAERLKNEGNVYVTEF